MSDFAKNRRPSTGNTNGRTPVLESGTGSLEITGIPKARSICNNEGPAKILNLAGETIVSRNAMLPFFTPMFAVYVTTVLLLAPLHSADWVIPLAGNAFRTVPEPGRGGFDRRGTVSLRDAAEVYSIYFRVDRPATLQFTLRANVPSGSSTLTARVGQQTKRVELTGSELAWHEIGAFKVTRAGYVRVDLQKVDQDESVLAKVRDLRVSSETPELVLEYVKTNEGNMFYWGRRGPSVHLRYRVPPDVDLQYAYTELTVPEGEDPIGSYFMANGFGEGYFGIQVNRPDERRVLFSVWSPFATDNPREIPEDQRIRVLARGPDVYVGEFGNEGSGGQSYLVYPWQAGRTYRFLTKVKPDGDGNTVYTSWFGEKTANEWRLIASFRRPRTDSHLRGFHSFLENFAPTHGYLTRRVMYGNVWVRDVEGNWHECTSARFSVDATGRGRHRLDFAGGSIDTQFYLKNGGFFEETGTPGNMFTRTSSGEPPPAELPTLD
jgi:hypothetical protein